MTRPTKEELETFIKEVNAMSLFEAEHRNLRGWGLYKPENIPIPAVMTVMKWLNEIVYEQGRNTEEQKEIDVDGYTRYS